jgi:hypothetical protein
MEGGRYSRVHSSGSTQPNQRGDAVIGWEAGEAGGERCSGSLPEFQPRPWHAWPILRHVILAGT